MPQRCWAARGCWCSTSPPPDSTPISVSASVTYCRMPDVMERSRAMQPHFAPDRLFAEITGATMAIPVEEIRRLRAALISGGAIAVVDEGEGLVVVRHHLDRRALRRRKVDQHAVDAVERRP